MARIRLVLVCLLSALFVPPVWTQENPPLTTLGQTADIVAIARLQSIVEPGGSTTPNITVQITVIQYLKGSAPTLNLLASIPARAARMQFPVSISPSTIGSAGIWFLKVAAGTYEILPRDRIAYGYGGDLYLPLNDISAPAGVSAFDDQLLAYLVRWYQSLTVAGLRDNYAFLSSFEPHGPQGVTPQQVLSAVAPLLQSPIRSQQLTGLIAALRVGSISAMQTVITNMPTLSSDPRFFDVAMAIGFYPKDASWIQVLQQLAAMHATVQGMDAAGVSALAKIGIKAVLPAMAEFLDSKDPAAQIAASSDFARFALLANSKGEVLDSSPTGPLWTPKTKAFMPGSPRLN